MDVFSLDTPSSTSRMSDGQIAKASRLVLQTLDAALDQPVCAGYAGATLVLHIGAFILDAEVQKYKSTRGLAQIRLLVAS